MEKKNGKMYVSWNDVKERVQGIRSNFPERYKFYGVPRGGSVIAAMLNPVDSPQEANVIVDDLIDSGATREQYKKEFPHIPFVTLFDKHARELKDTWLVFPWERSAEQDIAEHVARVLQFIGEDVNRIGLKETPERVVRSWKELYKGYSQPLPKITTFRNSADGVTYNQMIIDSGSFHSVCEHHMLPFMGKYHFCYIPNENGLILGLSKVARVVDHFSSRLQIQERIGSDVVRCIYDALTVPPYDKYPPLGIGIVLRANHLCKVIRGVKNNGEMVTSYLNGILLESEAKHEFINLIKTSAV